MVGTYRIVWSGGAWSDGVAQGTLHIYENEIPPWGPGNDMLVGWTTDGPGGVGWFVALWPIASLGNRPRVFLDQRLGHGHTVYTVD